MHESTIHTVRISVLGGEHLARSSIERRDETRPMRLQEGWINIYRSGVYHTPGKPSAFDRHGGDVYPSEAAAKEHIDPLSHYLDTVPVQWFDTESPLKVNE